MHGYEHDVQLVFTCRHTRMLEVLLKTVIWCGEFLSGMFACYMWVRSDCVKSIQL